MVAAVDFKRAFEAGTRRHGEYFAVHRIANGLPKPRLGMVVAVKVAGSSVARNRIKRLIREAFRLRQRELAGWDWIVRARKTFPAIAMTAARDDLARLL